MMLNLPDDIIFLFLSKLDLLSFLRFSIACKRNQRISQSSVLWKDICFTHPLFRHYVDLFKLNNDLKNNQFDIKLFCKSIFKKDWNALKSIIKADKTITVCIPSYEKASHTFKFFSDKAGFEKTVYLTETVARQKIANIKSVTKFISVEVPIHGIDLHTLLEVGELKTNHLIKNTSSIRRGVSINA